MAETGEEWNEIYLMKLFCDYFYVTILSGVVVPREVAILFIYAPNFF